MRNTDPRLHLSLLVACPQVQHGAQEHELLKRGRRSVPFDQIVRQRQGQAAARGLAADEDNRVRFPDAVVDAEETGLDLERVRNGCEGVDGDVDGQVEGRDERGAEREVRGKGLGG